MYAFSSRQGSKAPSEVWPLGSFIPILTLPKFDCSTLKYFQYKLELCLTKEGEFSPICPARLVVQYICN